MRRELIKKTPLDSFLWGISALPLGVYVIVQDLNIPLIIQPQLFGLFALLSWGQCMYYGSARSRTWCAAVLGGTLALWGILEVVLVFALRVRECSPSFPLGLVKRRARGDTTCRLFCAC